MRDYAHKDKVLRGFKGIGHNCNAERWLKRETKRGEGTRPYNSRICTKDGFWLAESDHEKVSTKKIHIVPFGAKDNLFRMSIEQSWTFRSPAEKSREATCWVSISDSPISINARQYGNSRSRI